MKKTLLIGAALLAGVSGYSQNNRQAANLHSMHNPAKAGRVVDAEAFPSNGTKRVSGPVSHHATNSVCTPMHATAENNIFTMGGWVTSYHQNGLSYNKDLNRYVITNRVSKDWTFPGKTSGAIQSTIYNPVTNTFDSTIVYRDSANWAWGRFPGGCWYNAAGNTNIANAYVVATGPTFSNDAGTFYATRKLTGTAADHTTFPQNDTGLNWTPQYSAIFGSAQELDYDNQQVGTNVYALATTVDTTTSANGNHITSSGGIIGKGDFSGANPVWSHDSIIPGFYFNRNGAGNGYASEGGGPRMAFFGQTGYMVFMGRLATNYGNSADSMMSPIVYKSTNGGATWALTAAGQGYDWRCKHPELAKNVGYLRSTMPKHFETNYKHGIDVTVDNTGTLHLVATMCEPYLDGASKDSVAFSYTYTHDYIDRHPIMWDLMTDGTDWKTMMIDSIASSYVGGDPASDSTAAKNPISATATGGSGLPYGARLQVSRSDDGTKIFYGWADSDPGSTGSIYNDAPDLWMRAYDVTSGKVTTSANITNGISVCYFHSLTDVAGYDAGTSKWTAAMVYHTPRVTISAGLYDGTGAADISMVTCASYAAADFATAAVVNTSTTCAVGIQNHTNNFFNSVSNYPNPFNHSTNIVVNLNESKAISINVFDAIGNLVAVKNVNGNIGANTVVFDAANLNAGVYYYTVTAGYEKVTKKMVIQK